MALSVWNTIQKSLIKYTLIKWCLKWPKLNYLTLLFDFNNIKAELPAWRAKLIKNLSFISILFALFSIV